jgi:hypothetical protein
MSTWNKNRWLLSNNSQQESSKLKAIRVLSLLATANLLKTHATHQYVSGKDFAFNSSLADYPPLLSLS